MYEFNAVAEWLSEQIKAGVLPLKCSKLLALMHFLGARGYTLAPFGTNLDCGEFLSRRYAIALTRQ